MAFDFYMPASDSFSRRVHLSFLFSRFSEVALFELSGILFAADEIIGPRPVCCVSFSFHGQFFSDHHSLILSSIMTREH